jgi:hypothetical protein
MRSLLLSLEAIECVCGHERSEKSNASRDKKASHSEKKGTKRPGTDNNARVPKKARTKKHCNLCKKHGGAYTTHNTGDCRRFEKEGTKNPISAPLRKAKKNQSHKAVFCAIKQENGLAREGDQEKRHQEAETLQ